MAHLQMIYLLKMVMFHSYVNVYQSVITKNHQRSFINYLCLRIAGENLQILALKWRLKPFFKT